LLIKIEGLKSYFVYRGKKYYLEGEDSLTLSGNDNLHRNEIDDIAEIQNFIENISSKVHIS